MSTYPTALPYATQAVASTSVPKTSHVSDHAVRLHEMAGDIGVCNQRLSGLLDRLYGPRPEVAGEGAKQQEPTGALLVATFGAERIRQQIDDLRANIARLEELA